MSNDTRNPNVKHYSSEDVVRLKKLVSEGLSVLQEVEDLRTGLNETIKAMAEEVGIKPAQLKKAINIIHKHSLNDERDKFEEIEDIITTLGYDK